MMVDLAPFKDLIVSHCGLVFENERNVTLEKGIRTRIGKTASASGEDYLTLLRRDPNEFTHLVDLLTVNETYFFREPAHLEILSRKIVPAIIEGERRCDPVRILSAGCSTGEEAYSVAIALMEAGCGEQSRVTGVDIDTTAIARARSGIFGKASFRGFPDHLASRYFTKEPGGLLKIGDDVRRRVEFRRMNLMEESYPEDFGLFDVIFYRNVSIYFPADIQRHIFRRLAALLREGGALFVSSTETLFHNVGVLSLVELDGTFLYRKLPEIVFEERRAPLPPQRPFSSRPLRPTPRPIQSSGPAPALSATPSRSPAHRLFDEALDLARKKRFDASISVIDRLLKDEPGFVKAKTLKGSILVNLNRTAEARTTCLSALEDDPLCMEACLLLGMGARLDGDEEEASRRFREAAYIDPSCWLAHFHQAEISFLRGEKERARRGYEMVTKILEKGDVREHGLTWFPLAFHTDQFITLCRHKMDLLDGSARSKG